VVVELNPGAISGSQRQYYIPHKAQIGIQKHLNKLLKYGILWPCQSIWNTPYLPVQKPGTADFRPVKDLCAVNSTTVTLHSVVVNPYTLLGLIPDEAKFFTLQDLLPLGAMTRVWIFTSTGKLINHIWINEPNKPVSIYFNSCATIAKNTGPGASVVG
jgi:hypothetical protein